MSKRNMWLSTGVVVIVAAVVVYALVHKSPKVVTTSTTPPSSNSSTTTPPASTPANIVATKTDPSLGQYLVGASGQPLYTYGGDTTGVSNCTASCIVAWPVYGPTSSSANLPTNVTIITRSDGKAQYAYKGLPLYSFTSDNGSTPSGNGISNFHIAKP